MPEGMDDTHDGVPSVFTDSDKARFGTAGGSRGDPKATGVPLGTNQVEPHALGRRQIGTYLVAFGSGIPKSKYGYGYGGGGG